MTTEFINIINWLNTWRKYIPKSRRTHSKCLSSKASIDFRAKNKSEKMIEAEQVFTGVSKECKYDGCLQESARYKERVRF